MLADLGEASHSLLLAVVVTSLEMQSCGRKLTYFMMVAICNLPLECGHYTLKQMYKNVLNIVVKVTKWLMSLVGHPLHNHQNYGRYWLLLWWEY